MPLPSYVNIYFCFAHKSLQWKPFSYSKKKNSSYSKVTQILDLTYIYSINLWMNLDFDGLDETNVSWDELICRSIIVLVCIEKEELIEKDELNEKWIDIWIAYFTKALLNCTLHSLHSFSASLFKNKLFERRVVFSHMHLVLNQTFDKLSIIVFRHL